MKLFLPFKNDIFHITTIGLLSDYDVTIGLLTLNAKFIWCTFVSS